MSTVRLFKAACCYLALLVVIVRAQCPASCSCPTDDEVLCINANYTSIPRIIAHTTTTLDLSGNRISHVTYSSLTSLRNMVNLKLKNNDITSIDDGSFQTMEQLQTLELGTNHISTITEQTLYGIEGITVLDISFNNLRHIDGAFKGLTHLSSLDLRNNQIQRVSQFTFRDQRNLRYLFLAYNQIAHVDKRAFRHMDKLIYLVLKGNPLYQLPKLEFHYTTLSYIDFSECKLTEIPRGLPNSVRYLQLRRNNISEINVRALRDYPYVSILVLDENGLSYIEDGTFSTMTYLQQLWLNGNKLTTIPSQLPPSLQRLLMDQNHVTSISRASFSSANQLDTISLMSNRISAVQYSAFGALLVLGSLDLSDNRLEHIYGNMFENNTELHTLQLSKNPLHSMHSHALWGLVNLRALSLAFIESPHVSIHDDVTRDLQQLQALDLTNSAHVIDSFITNAALTRPLVSLETLNIANSQLSTLQPSFLTRFVNLSKLILSSSYWHCDTNIRWLRDWLSSPQDSSGVTIEIEDDDVTCYSPASVHGRRLVSLADDEFVHATTINGLLSSTLYPPAALTTFPTPRVTTVATGSGLSNTKKTKSRDMTTTRRPTAAASEDDDDDDDDDTGTKYRTGDGDDSVPKTHDDYQGHFGDYIDPDYIDFEYHQSNNDPTGGRRHVDPFDELFNKSRSLSDIERFWLGNGEYHVTDTTFKPEVHPSKQKPRDPGGGNDGGGAWSNPSNVTIIITIVSIATAIIAAIIIAFIIYFVRKQRTIKDKPPQPQSPLYKNGIMYKHNNDVLYFMPNGVSAQDNNGDTNAAAAAAAERQSVCESVRTSSSGKSKASKTTTNNKEQMTLIPGRDINHEGPMRVYKWEDF